MSEGEANLNVAAPPRPGDEIAGVRLVEELSADGLRRVWRGDVDAVNLAVHVLEPSADGAAVERFRRSAVTLLRLAVQAPIPGVLRLHAIRPDGRAFVADLWTVGNVSDLPALGWPLERRLELFRQVCAALDRLHDAGIGHGCLLPSNVLLDDELRPILSDVGMLDPVALVADPATAPYVAPELANGQATTRTSDVFSAGQLLHFLLLDGDPPLVREGLPKLESLAETAPAGLVRILRRCLAGDPVQRYGKLSELVDELRRFTAWESVGLAHPEVREKNLKGTAMLAAPARPAVPASVDSAVKKPAPRKEATPRKEAASRKEAAPKKKSGPTAAAPRGKALDDPEQPEWMQTASLVSLLALCLCILLGYLTGAVPIVWRILGALACAGATLRLKLGADMKPRIVAGAIASALGFVANVGGFAAAAGAAGNLQSSDPAQVVAAIKHLKQSGKNSFTNAMLRGADLGGLDLTDATLDNSDMSGANLAGANLSSASLIAVNLENANLAGANLTGAKLMMTDLTRAKCDGRTVFGKGWSCQEGRPTR